MRRAAFSLAFTTALALLGCGGANPAAPPQGQASPALPSAVDVVQGNGLEAGTALAAWDLTLDGGRASLEPTRTGAAIGDSFTISGTFFFTVSPDPAALIITGFRYDGDGHVEVQWGIRHPFRSVAQGATRADLDVFDVALAFQPRNEPATPIAGADREVYANLLANASGYTAALAEAIGDFAALPFRTLEMPDPYNRFAQGTDYQPMATAFQILPGQQRSLRIYLLCQYGVSATRPTRLNPRYFNPEYNQKSAWRVDVTETGNTLIDGQAGALDFTAAVYDWQHGLAADPAYPDDANPTGLRAASDVAGVTAFIPGLSPTPVEVNTPAGGTGAPGDPLLYPFSVATAAAPAEGEHLALLKVRDSRTPNDNISPSTSGIDAGATGDLVYFPLDEYATYQTLRYTVAPAVDPNQPPVAALSTNPNPPVITQGGSVTFNAGTSSDPDGAIVSYEWDFDYQPGSPVWTPGTATPPAQVFPTPGTYTVAVQVTDDGTPPLTDIETVAVTVNPPPPVSNKAVWAAYPSGGIMRGNADGTGATVINGSGRYPRISADGNTVVFSAGAGIGGSLYVWRQSTGVMLIRAQADDPQGYGFRADEVDLSADGSKVVYTDARAGANPPKDCWISDWNGANLVRLTPNDGGCHEMPKIAANGSMVVLYKRSTGRVLKVNPNGTGLTDIGPCTDGPPFLNATGTTVYVKRTFNTLWKTDIDGNNAVSIRTVGNYFAVAANESKVVYDGGGQSVWLANLDGTGTPIQLLNPSVDGYNGWFVSINNDGTWAGWGGLLNRGGTYDVANGLKYQAPAVFANQLYDGVTVGPVGMF